MEGEAVKNYLKAGKINAAVRVKEGGAIKPGQRLLEIAERIEKAIESAGARPAFPVNLSLNNNAAHYTPPLNDETVLGEKDVLKVDIGVHVDGFIADAAFTLDFSGEHGKMVEAAGEALENAKSIIKAGISLSKIGEEIEKTIRGKGFSPIQNLSGHGLAKFDAHAAPSIPNISKNDERQIEEGRAYAVEPFACNGRGFVREAQQAFIFELDEVRPLRNLEARKILERVEGEYKTLPFAERWIQKGLSEFKFKVALRELLQRKAFKMHPILREEKGVIVTQAESSFIVDNGKVVWLE